MNTPPPTTVTHGRRPILTAALAVATAAGVATAHGLYQVAAASRVPTPVAWLYPIITDGLALVAYAATTRLTDRGRRYAATIVVLAAGLSGLAQAVYLAGGIDTRAVAPVGLRFGVGAWPAAAAALTAHLLHLVVTAPAKTGSPAALSSTCQLTSNSDAVHPYSPLDVHPYNPGGGHPAVQAARTTAALNTPAVQPERSTDPESDRPGDASLGRSGSEGVGARPRDRAQDTARSHYARHGVLPTVTELVAAAQVARGTAGAVLKDLRASRPALHIVTPDQETSTDP